MTATVDNPAEGTSGTATGRVVRVIGPVVDVEFSADSMPEIYNALHVDVKLGDETRTLTLEVEQPIGDDVVRAISLAPTDGMVRGTEVTDTGPPIEVPVVEGPKGRGCNPRRDTLAAPASSLDIQERCPSHLDPALLDQLE